MKLETKRLILRNYTLNDLKDYHEFSKMYNVGPRAGWNPHKTIEYSKEHLKKIIRKKYLFAIYIKEDKKVIGSIEIRDTIYSKYNNYINKNSKEIGCVLSNKYWNRGIMTEAVNIIIKYCFEKLKIKEIYATCAKNNIESNKLQQKCGFKIEKIIKNKHPYLGKIDDLIIRKINIKDYVKNL